MTNEILGAQCVEFVFNWIATNNDNIKVNYKNWLCDL